jgi:hypothetical protein
MEPRANSSIIYLALDSPGDARPDSVAAGRRADAEHAVAGTGLVACGRRRRQPQTTRPVAALKVRRGCHARDFPSALTYTRLRLAHPITADTRLLRECRLPAAQLTPTRIPP